MALRTSNGLNYVTAEGGGGFGIRADWTAAGPGSWTVFGVASVSGGPLVSGDRLALTAPDGTHFLQAASGGGTTLNAASASLGVWETFTLERIGGGAIRHGEAVALGANDSGFYVSADGGGGQGMRVTARTRGPFETFTLLFVSPHSTDVAPTPISTGAGVVRSRVASTVAMPTSEFPRLVAILSTPTESGVVRSAVFSMGNAVQIVNPGDVVSTLVVRTIESGVVELVDRVSGRTHRVVLRVP